MLTRICLIVAIVAGLATAGLNFVKVKETISTLRENLAAETSAKETAMANENSAKKKEAAAKKELESTKTDLATAQEERDKAVAEADTKTKLASRISEELSRARQDLDDAQSEVAAWKALGIPVDEVGKRIAELKQVKEERGKLAEMDVANKAKITSLKNRLAQILDPEDYRVELPSDLTGKVLVADPKWDFVVLNIGQNQGLLENGVLLVNRNGRLVAKVQVRSVQADRAIANVLPNWKLGEVMEGDQVIP